MLSKLILTMSLLFLLIFTLNVYSTERTVNYNNTDLQNNSSIAQQNNSNERALSNSSNSSRYAAAGWMKLNKYLGMITNKKDYVAMKKTMDEYYGSHPNMFEPKKRSIKNARENALQQLESYSLVSGSPWQIMFTLVGKWDPYYNVSINSNYNDDDFWAFFVSGNFERFDYYQQADAKRIYAQWHVVTFYPLIIAIKYPKNPYSIVYSVQIRNYLTYFAMYLKNITQNEKGNLDVYDADIVLSRDKF
ncbi:MAG: hypothetical protein GY756_10110 [bacterium]|nr:hypothetical protein [bacterium]